MKAKLQKRTATIAIKAEQGKKSVKKTAKVIAAPKKAGSADKPAKKKPIAASPSEKVREGKKTPAATKSEPKKISLKAKTTSVTNKKVLTKTVTPPKLIASNRKKVTEKPVDKAVVKKAVVKKPAMKAGKSVKTTKKTEAAVPVKKAVKKNVEKKPVIKKAVVPAKSGIKTSGNKKAANETIAKKPVKEPMKSDKSKKEAEAAVSVKKIVKKNVEKKTAAKEVAAPAKPGIKTVKTVTEKPVAQTKKATKTESAKPAVTKKTTAARAVKKTVAKKETTEAKGKTIPAATTPVITKGKTEPAKSETLAAKKTKAPSPFKGTDAPLLKTPAVGTPSSLTPPPASPSLVKRGTGGVKSQERKKVGIDSSRGESVKIDNRTGANPWSRPKSAPDGKTAKTVKTPVPELLSVAEIEEREGIKRPLRIFLPGDEMPEETRKSTKGKKPSGLPETYGENSFILMVVDPMVIYLDWEIIGPKVSPDKYTLAVRVYDVTGKDDEASDSFFEIRLDRESGSGYFEIMMSGKEIIAGIGLLDSQGGFRIIKRSQRVSVPPILEFDELGIVRKLLESGIPVGY